MNIDFNDYDKGVVVSFYWRLCQEMKYFAGADLYEAIDNALEWLYSK